MQKVCVITGCCGGIGKEIVKKFYRNNYFLVLLEQNLQKTSDLVKELGIEKNFLIFEADISREEQVKTVAREIESKIGKIDCLINSAGICGRYDLVENYCFENFKRIYEVNVFGTFLMMKYFIHLLKKNRKGSIVNFSSVSGIRGYDYEIGYGSSKWAVIGMTKTAAVEYGKDNIRINCVAPGWVDPMTFASPVF